MSNPEVEEVVYGTLIEKRLTFLLLLVLVVMAELLVVVVDLYIIFVFSEWNISHEPNSH